MTKEIDYHEFVKIFRTNDTIEANEYLDFGWILLNVEKIQVAEQSFNTYFVLGWNKPIQDVKYGRDYGQRMKDEYKAYYGEDLEFDSKWENPFKGAE